MPLRISGRRPLHTLPGQHTRPTSARVRQAVFNILQGQVAGSRWLDLCAGSGAMGAEALTRQCASVVGVELSPKAVQVVKQNWEQVRQPHQSIQVICGDAVQVVGELAAQGQQFDLIYCDPPYHSPVYAQVLPQLPPLAFDRAAASDYLKTQDPVKIRLDLHQGFAVGVAWGCDLSYDYVRINAEYTT